LIPQTKYQTYHLVVKIFNVLCWTQGKLV